MWLHWTINLLSWIIDCIQLHPVVLQPVPPMDQFPTEEGYHRFREFRIVLTQLSITRDQLQSTLRQVQEIPHDDLAALTRTWQYAWHHAQYRTLVGRSPPDPRPDLRPPADQHVPHDGPPPPADTIRLQPTPQHGHAPAPRPAPPRDRSRTPPARADDTSTSTPWTTSSHTTSQSVSPAGRAGLHASLWRATHDRRDPVTSFTESPDTFDPATLHQFLKKLRLRINHSPSRPPTSLKPAFTPVCWCSSFISVNRAFFPRSFFWSWLHHRHPVRLPPPSILISTMPSATHRQTIMHPLTSLGQLLLYLHINYSTPSWHLSRMAGYSSGRSPGLLLLFELPDTSSQSTTVFSISASRSSSSK